MTQIWGWSSLPNVTLPSPPQRTKRLALVQIRLLVEKRLVTQHQNDGGVLFQGSVLLYRERDILAFLCDRFTKIDKYEVIEVTEECVAKKRSVEKWLVTLRQNGELHISTSGENRTNAFWVGLILVVSIYVM